MNERISAGAAIEKLIDLMATLRGPNGCPWDLKQTHQSLRPYLIEEAYEVLEALDQEDECLLKSELGDLLFQIVFHCQLGRERDAFTLSDVALASYEKMHRRHPHVFGDESADSTYRTRSRKA